MDRRSARILAIGHEGVPVHFYSPGEAKANIVPTVISSIELFSTIGLLATIILSSIFTHRAKRSYSFVRTSLALYFTSLLACEAISAVSEVITVSWIVNKQVFSGGICTAQGFLRHFSNVALALWTMGISLQALVILRRAHNLEKRQLSFESLSITNDGRGPRRLFLSTWVVMAIVWFASGLLVVLGLIVGTITKHDLGNFYGVSDESCGIITEFLLESIIFSSAIMIFAALASAGMFAWIVYLMISLRSLGVDAKVGLMDKVDGEKLSVVMAQRMAWYPLVYTVCVLPVIVEMIIGWTNTAVPVGYSVFANTVYHLIGIIDVLIFVLTPRTALFPHRSQVTLSPIERRDLEAEAEMIKAQIAAAGVSTNEPRTDAPPPTEPSPPSDSHQPAYRPTRARSPPFPLPSPTMSPMQRYLSFRDATKALSAEPSKVPIPDAPGRKSTEDQDVTDAMLEDAALAEKLEKKLSGVPVVLQSPPLAAPSPRRPVTAAAPLNIATRPGRDQAPLFIKLPDNLLAKSTEAHDGTKEKHRMRVIVGTLPYDKLSDSTPHAASTLLMHAMISAALDAPQAPKVDTPSNVRVMVVDSNSRFAREQKRWMPRVVRESRSLASLRSIPFPRLLQRPTSEPESPDSFMDSEAAEIERSHSELSSLSSYSHTDLEEIDL
ncbi:unnamed protein product [Peniophora sp. CBMAI 1063]|nr:unnamed protein product [Peniophora sp. CBMAI 1063]